jgi:hypothetical protein
MFVIIQPLLVTKHIGFFLPEESFKRSVGSNNESILQGQHENIHHISSNNFTTIYIIHIKVLN